MAKLLTLSYVVTLHEIGKHGEQKQDESKPCYNYHFICSSRLKGSKDHKHECVLAYAPDYWAFCSFNEAINVGIDGTGIYNSSTRHLGIFFLLT